MAYGNTTDAQAYWTARGYTGTPTAALLAVASTYVDALGWRQSRSGVLVSRFPGIPASASQVDQWPREGAVDAYGRDIASDTVPPAVLNATYEAAYYESQNAGALNTTVRADQRVIRERVDVIDVQYSEAESVSQGAAGSLPVIPAVMALLAPVLTGGSNPYGITGIVA